MFNGPKLCVNNYTTTSSLKTLLRDPKYPITLLISRYAPPKTYY